MRLLLSSMHARCQRLAAVGGHTFRSDRSSSGACCRLNNPILSSRDRLSRAYRLPGPAVGQNAVVAVSMATITMASVPRIGASSTFGTCWLECRIYRKTIPSDLVPATGIDKSAPSCGQREHKRPFLDSGFLSDISGDRTTAAQRRMNPARVCRRLSVA